MTAATEGQPSAPGRVDGKVVIVTGAAGGQGAAEVAWLVGEGAHVVATDVADDAPLPSGRGSAVYRRLDVTSPDGWADIVAATAGEHGAVHGLVNNAGIAHRARLDTVTLEDWNRVLAVNLTGALLGIQAVTPVMPSGGSIVNVASVAALTAHYPVAYTASKWALRGLSRVASMELGPRGIRVNSIFPGYIATPMTASAPAAFLEASLAVAPLGRSGHPRGRRPARRLPALGRVGVRERGGGRGRRRAVRAWRREGAVGRPEGGVQRDDGRRRTDQRGCGGV